MEQFEQQTSKSNDGFDPTELFFQKMYKVCFRFLAPTTQQIDSNFQKQLENCYLRFFKTYRLVCEEAHKYEDDFINDDDEEYDDDEDFDEDDDDFQD